MRTTPKKGKEFLKLQKTWYGKIQKAGFKDIEQDENNLKIWDSYRIKAKHTPETFQAKQDYYQFATDFLNTHEFKTKTEKLIWESHSQGLSAREIVNLWKQKGRKDLAFPGLQKLLTKLSKEMLKTCLIKKT